LEVLSQFQIQDPPVPIEKIVRDLGLEVIYEELPYDTSSVLIRQPEGRKVIGVNSRHAPTRRRFSLAHELGHALLHLPEESSDDGEAMVSRPLQILFRDGMAGQGISKVEIDANVFAASLLMPKDVVTLRFGKSWRQDQNRKIDEIVGEMAEQFDVSTQAMQYRLINLDLVDPA